EAREAERAARLAAARLPHEGNRLPRPDVPRHSVDRAHHAARSRELRLEVFDVEEKISILRHCPGSLAHARARPLNPCHQVSVMNERLEPGGWHRGWRLRGRLRSVLGECAQPAGVRFTNAKVAKTIAQPPPSAAGPARPAQ